MQLDGRKINLRDWQAEDLPLWTHWLQPSHAWQETDGPYYPDPSPGEVVNMVERTRARIEADDWPTPRHNLVIAEAATNKLTGLVTWSWQSVETHWPEVGISIYDPAMWGQGVGYEALGLWGDYLFEKLPQIVRLDLRTWSGHIGMMKLALKLGYKEEARFRMARIVKGQYYDGLGYGVLRSEWQQLYPNGFAATKLAQ